jgi:hypothetical protein
MTNPAERWKTYLRYDTTIARDFFRTIDTLTRLQSARRRSTPPKSRSSQQPPASRFSNRLSKCPILGFGPFRKIACHSRVSTDKNNN